MISTLIVAALGLSKSGVWSKVNQIQSSAQIFENSNQDCSVVKNLYKSLGGSYSFDGYNCCGWNFVDCSHTDVVNFTTASKPYVMDNKKTTWGPDQFDGYPCEVTDDPYCDTDFRKADIDSGSGFVTVNYYRMSFFCTKSSCTMSTQKIPRVTAIYWRKQSLTGYIPPFVRNLTRLRVLSLSENYIRGSIPKEIGDLNELQGLELDGNSLTGIIPSTLINLSQLSRLFLSANMLTGAIPDKIGTMRSLVSIDLSNNKLGGSIPRSIYTLPFLTILNLENNFFSGNIFPELVNPSPSLIRLSLANNVLSGIIPSRIGTLVNLTYLSLADNKLEGLIPGDIGNLKSLDFLQVSGNKLSGAVPDDIAKLSLLTTMDLSNNNLNGSFPSSINKLKNLQYLRIEKNAFQSVPDSIANMTSTTSVSQPLVARNPSFTLSTNDWLGILNTSSITKRQYLSPGAHDLTAHELFQMCPLNDVTNPNVAAGCVAGIYQMYCANLAPTFAAYSRCQNTYDKVFDVSIFKPLGDVCPAWRDGPRSAACMRAVSTFSVNLGYIVVNSQMAGQLVNNIFGSRLYAPCMDFQGIVCRW